MSRWKLAVCGLAVACVACGSAVVERTSTGPGGQGLTYSGSEQGSIPAQAANPAYTGSTNSGSIIQRTGTTRPVPPPAARLVERDAPLLPPAASNPCGRTGKSAPACPVGAP